MNKIGIIGIILLSICLCAQTTIGSTNKPSNPPDPITTDLYHINIASVNNGGSVEYWPNCGIGDGNKNNIIDEDEDSYIFMNIDPQWSSYVIIDFKGEYNYIGDIQIKFRHQSHPTDPGEIEIYLHVKEGNKEHWKRVIKFDNVANGQRFDFSLRNHNNLDFDFFECEADKIKIETEGGFLREWFAYEVKVINTEITPPILKLDSPNEGFLYVLSIPLISTGRDHALVIGNMPIIVNAYDFESGIKEIKLKTPFGTKNPSVSNGN